MAKKQKDNYLDYMPRRNSLYEWHDNKEGNVEVKVYNKGFFNKVAQTLFKKPKFSNIELDEFGSFIWRACDGEKTIYEIGQDVKEHFGEKAEPLYGRLTKFIKILHDNHYVVYANKIKNKDK